MDDWTLKTLYSSGKFKWEDIEYFFKSLISDIKEEMYRDDNCTYKEGYNDSSRNAIKRISRRVGFENGKRNKRGSKFKKSS
jgi:hypothetical protein